MKKEKLAELIIKKVDEILDREEIYIESFGGIDEEHWIELADFILEEIEMWTCYKLVHKPRHLRVRQKFYDLKFRIYYFLKHKILRIPLDPPY